MAKNDAEGKRTTTFDPALFRRDSFCMQYRDAAGSGACYMMVTTTGFFRSASWDETQTNRFAFIR